MYARRTFLKECPSRFSFLGVTVHNEKVTNCHFSLDLYQKVAKRKHFPDFSGKMFCRFNFLL